MSDSEEEHSFDDLYEAEAFLNKSHAESSRSGIFDFFKRIL